MKGSSPNGRSVFKPEAITGVPVLMRTNRFMIPPSVPNRESSETKAQVLQKLMWEAEIKLFRNWARAPLCLLWVLSSRLWLNSDGPMPTSHPPWAAHVTCSCWHPVQQFIFNQIRVSICNSDVPISVRRQALQNSFGVYLKVLQTPIFTSPGVSTMSGRYRILRQPPGTLRGCSLPMLSDSCPCIVKCNWLCAVTVWHLSWLCQSADVRTFAKVIILWYWIFFFFSSMLGWLVFHLLVCKLCPGTSTQDRET